MRIIKYYAKAYGKIFTLEPLLLPLVAIIGICSGVTPFVNIYYSSKIIAVLSSGADSHELIRLVAVSILLNFILYVLNSGASSLHGWLRNRMVNKERCLIEEKLYSLDFAKLENSDFQEKVHLYRESCEKLYSPFAQLIWMTREFIKGVVTVIFSFLMLMPLIKIGLTKTGVGFVHSPWFFAVLFSAIALSVGVILILSSKTSKLWFDTQERYSKLDRLFRCYRDLLADYKSGKEVRLYKEQKLIEDEATGELLTNGEKILREMSSKSARSSAYIAIVGALVGFGIYLFIGVKGLLGLFAIDALVRYAGSFMQTVNGITNIAITLGRHTEIASSAEYFFDIINTKSEMTYGEKTVDLQNAEIEFRNVSFRYPGNKDYTLKNISVKINSGERLAVVGRNGSGKTTFIKLLCRLYDPDEGEIFINGVNLKDLTRENCAELYAVVFQDFKLFSLTVRENIACGEEADDDRLKNCLQQSDIHERIEQLPLKENTTLYKDIDEDGVDVSGGEAQKLALARALYKNAPIVVLDEPTAALDPVAEHSIYERFNSFVDGRTAIYISHRLSSCRFCNTIAVFKSGRLIEHGAHEDLLSRENSEYRKLWEVQAKYYLQ